MNHLFPVWMKIHVCSYFDVLINGWWSPKAYGIMCVPDLLCNYFSLKKYAGQRPTPPLNCRSPTSNLLLSNSAQLLSSPYLKANCPGDASHVLIKTAACERLYDDRPKCVWSVDQLMAYVPHSWNIVATSVCHHPCHPKSPLPPY